MGLDLIGLDWGKFCLRKGRKKRGGLGYKKGIALLQI
jgi:hypothetical protein